MKTRPLLVTLFVLVIAVVLAVGGLYWHQQTVIKDTARTLKYAVTKDSHDPEFARFRSVRLHSLDGSVWERIRAINFEVLRRNSLGDLFSLFTYRPAMLQLCGEVNAKNAFGAYVGYKAFYISGDDKPHPFIDSRDGDKFAKEMCEIFSKFVVYSEP